MTQRQSFFLHSIKVLSLVFATMISLLNPQSCHGAIVTEKIAISVNQAEETLLNRGEVVIRELKHQDVGMQTFEALGKIKASPETLAAILTDFEHYPDFMPNIEKIEVLSRNNEEVIMNYLLGLPMGQKKRYRLKLSFPFQDETSFLLRWSLVPWPELKPEETIRDTTGYWLVQKDADVQSLVLYHVSTDPGDIPFGLGWIVDILTKQSVPDTITALRNRAVNTSIVN